jgi:uncharacterized membrane protein YqiK
VLQTIGLSLCALLLVVVLVGLMLWFFFLRVLWGELNLGALEGTAPGSTAPSPCAASASLGQQGTQVSGHGCKPS